jgi:transposase
MLPIGVLLPADAPTSAFRSIARREGTPRSSRNLRSTTFGYISERAGKQFWRLSHLWLDAGYRGEDKGKDWVEKTLGWSVELVERLRKPAPEEVLMNWAEEWAKEGKKVDWQKLLPPRGFQVLPRRWVVEHSFAWICHNRRMSKDYERLCATGEAFVHAAMSRLMVRRLAHA